MGNPSRFLPSCFKVITKTAGHRKSEISKGNEKHAKIQYPAALPEEIYRYRQFSLTEIKAATNNFHPKSLIAEGLFGNVFKGIVDDGNFVAVKRFFPDSVQDALNEFQTEVKLLCQLRHQHLVSLIGYCNDKDEKILVYQHMKNGTLRDHLYGCNYDPLPWKQRLEICIGAARGLHYLHTGAKHAVIHSNVNSSNILLDDKWVSMLSSFGLSKMRPQPSYSNTTKVLKKINSRLVGTVGYVDPEYLRGCELSEKCDVYSFGVVLFEVLCARRSYDSTLDENEQFLVYWVRWCIGEGIIYNIIDSYLKGKIALECLKIFVDIAYCCTNEKGDTRPDMGEVELMLELALEMQEKADTELVDVDPHAALPEEICRQFSLPEIRAATNNFHPNLFIGKGGFGTVYKGIVDDGTLVAVKRLRQDTAYGLKEFRTEVQLLCQLCHQHLVSLIGYCNDKDEKIVVYELMKNGSLGDHLYGRGYDPLPWKQRLEILLCARRAYDSTLDENELHLADCVRGYIGEGTIYNIIDPYLKGKIAPECFKIFVDIAYCCINKKGDTRPEMGERLEICIGAARGLHYLHTGAKHAVIRSNVNSSNILLDDKWVSMLSSFGLSKMCPQPSYSNTTKVLKKINSRLVGTVGYVDPEYLRGCELSEKCDVYSFGVVLFEVLCTRRSYDSTLDENEQFLVYWVRWCIGEGIIYNIIDSYLKGKIAPECLKIFVDIAYCCTNEKGDTRPDMGEVELMLELALEMQEKADTELVDVDPHGKYMYEEVSFCISISD
ncbi:Malectin/receptor protein kinase family protein [Theobroma cacao]|uniref:Malectin/receptor protein kinase family protein n=1 Tax=Theobroma cacao TaxID=3641 RepID=S1SM86_THECC|nr:Malectin/receptor protein kinase family protein [Theobroma cacao]